MIVPSACNEANRGDIAKVVLMPGDPLRAKYVAEHYLEDISCFNTVRNMFGYTGTYKGKRISVMGSGMGVPSIGLYAFELYNYFDVDSIIRIGSAGGIASHIKLRDVVIAMGASTNSAYANQYCFPGTLAPLASYELLKHAADAAERIGAHAVPGPIFTADQFYDANPDSAKKYLEMGILAVEMETAGLYLTAAKAGKKALSILTISDLVFTGEGLTALERQDSFTEMMEIALETAWKSLD